jgi:HEAT repeat protein
MGIFRSCGLACLLAGAVFGQVADKKAPEPDFLLEALNHPSPAIRLRAAQRLTDEKIRAVPQLLQSVERGADLSAVRAGVVLIDRLDLLYGNTDQNVRSLNPKDQQKKKDLDDVRRLVLRSLIPLIHEPRTEPWRWYLAVYLLDKISPDALGDVLPDIRSALRPGEAPMKQYAAVQALYRLRDKGRTAQDDLWALLASRPCFRGLYVGKRVLEDDMAAYTDEIGVYNLSFGLQREEGVGASVYVTPELFVLETLHRIGADDARLAQSLAFMAHHESQDVRLEVARQLGALTNAEAKVIAAHVLVRLLEEYDSVLRTQMAAEKEEDQRETDRLFTNLNEAGACLVPSLLKLLSNRENRVRLSAARLLGKLSPPEPRVLSALEKALIFEELREGDDARAIADAIREIQKKAKGSKR